MKNIEQFFKQLFHRIAEDDIFGLAAQLAYFFLLSLFPFLLFLVTLIGYLPLDEHAITDFLGTYAPEETMDLIKNNMSQLVNKQNGGLLSISIIGTLWSASNGIKAIMRAFNRAYDVEEDRSFVFGRLIAIVLTIAMVLVICMAFLLPIFGKMIGEYVFSLFGYSDNFIQFWTMMRWVISSIIFFIVLTLLYKLAPNRHIYFKDAIWGAIFATIGWQLVSLAFSYYVNTLGNYSATYGSLGAVIVLMIWFYLSGIIIIIGGVINAVIMKNKLEE
ncbi:YihY family inner membrane protein [Virgibacillus dakarensis]|uniref:Ribonuclease-like protein YfkH n=1 Tax=Lentibacillus populi TaxID=1827502 RepID=A0A9W5X7W7_9BACI|nr:MULTISPECIES: YihY/virulence factor BrkB family protein [Bacillaceae]MTW88290.1 YihY family inner membrane protein [Virgibacillus dakarensis]GGB59795.1 putative ribonuclease-like protein YfkH [Lentibacillus populi]